MNNLLQLLRAGSFLVLTLICAGGRALADFGPEFEAKYPTSSSFTAADCQLCHGASTSRLNSYGRALQDSLSKYGGTAANITAAFTVVQSLNSDADAGANSNLTEINASAQPGWTTGSNNITYPRSRTGATALETAPAGILLDPASAPPPLPTVMISATTPNASETGPTAGQFTVSRTGSTASALTVNYGIGGSATNTTDYANLSGTVTIGAGSVTALITVMPVDDALVEGNETVMLTLSANAAYTVGSPSNATVTIADNDSAPPPPPTGPMIALNTAKLDFGQVQVLTNASRTASVHNIGDATLEVTAITACAGTSSEYTWSPSTFTLNPGSSQTLTVFYQPMDQTSDAGCLQLASNDTTQNPETLALVGVGVMPPLGPVVDIDIARFSTTRQVNLMRPRPVKIQVVVRNPGSIAGSANVTVIAEQNHVEIYNQTLPVTLNKRGNKRLQFPSYIPTDQGDIVWTVTVDDADPDFDEATATTIVQLGAKGHHEGGGWDRERED